MGTRDNQQGQLTDDINAGLLGSLPTEIFIEIAEQLPLPNLNNIRETCRFFGNHSLLKETISKKKIYKVIPRASHTLWLFKNGNVFGTGSNHFNALGLGEEIKSCFNPTPIILPSQNPITKIVAGSSFTFFFDTEGHCYSCGSNTYGQLGEVEATQGNFKEMHLPNGRPIIDVALGHTTTFLCDDRGSWFAMGKNENGELGVNRQERRIDTPTLISLPSKLPIAKIVPCHCNTFFQDIEGHWFHSGFSFYIGKKGAKSAKSVLESFTLPNGKPIVEIVAMWRSVFCRSQDSQWFSCGENSDMQLGNLPGSNFWGEDYSPLTPIQLVNGKAIDKIITSGHHTVIRDVDGQWFGCGLNDYGQLLRKINHKIGLTPIELPNHKQISEICLGDKHTLLRDQEGNWYGCGKNEHGELGPTTTMNGQVFSIDPSNFESGLRECVRPILLLP